MGDWLRRLWYLLNRRRLESELQQDMEAHREMLGAPNRFGNTLRLREDARDVWGWRWLDNISQDLRYAFRTIRRNPAFTAVVVISLGLGIGANTALFSVFDAKFFRSLPVKNPDQLVMLKWRARTWRPDRLSGRLSMYDGSDGHEATSTGWSFSPFALEKFRTEGQTLAAVCAFTSPSDRSVIVDGSPDRVKVVSVSDNYFSTLGVSAVAGRLIEPEASQAPVAVISHRFWQTRFARNPAAIGKTVALNGTQLTIIGVMPPDFNGSLTITGESPQVVIPLNSQAQVYGMPIEQDRWALQIMARMKPGTNLQQVRGNLEGLFQGIAEQAAANTSPRDIPRLIVESGKHGLDDRGLVVSDLLKNVTGASGLLLLIVCLNVANLLMARAAAREYEIAVRLSMGASRRRVIRQLLTESLVLAIISAALGVLIAHSGKDILRVFLGQEMDLVRIDGHVLGFTILASVLTAILFGLAPALQATRMDLNSSIKKVARNAAGGRTRLNKILLVVQVSGSVMLLVGAGLLLRTMAKVPQIDVGFNTNSLLLFQLETRGLNYNTQRLIAICDEIQARISALPNVIATTSSATPLLSRMMGYELVVPGSPVHPSSSLVQWTDVEWNFPDIMGVPILRGRTFRQSDSRVAIINEKAAHAFFGDVDPIGRHIILYSIVRKEKVPTELEVIGVARDVGVRGSTDDIRPTVFRSSQRSLPAFAVRTSVDPTSLMPAIREILRTVDASVPVFDVKTESDAVKEGFANTQVLSVACGIFGGLALVLTCIGLYGLLSYTVTRRTNEIGIRMALGAQRVEVVRFVMAEAFLLVLAGLLIGLTAARMMNEAIRGLVYGVTPFDLSTIAGVVAIVLLMTSLSVFLPARRASRVDPTTALRQE